MYAFDRNIEYRQAKKKEISIKKGGERMSVNEVRQTICDITGVILDDGVTLLPGYVEVKGGKIYQHFSTDPKANGDAKPWELKNRVKFRKVVDTKLKADKGVKNGMHFMDIQLYKQYAAKLSTELN